MVVFIVITITDYAVTVTLTRAPPGYSAQRAPLHWGGADSDVHV